MLAVAVIAAFFCLVLVISIMVLLADTSGTATGPATGPATEPGYKDTTAGLGDKGVSVQPPTDALVVETMRDFKWVDSLVYPRGAAPEIPNIQQVQRGHFKFILRHRKSWYDGDRDLQWNEGRHSGAAGRSVDKSRAELCCIKGIDRPFTLNSTWLIGSTVRLAPDFVPSWGYCNVMQPANHQSFLMLSRINGDMVTAELRVFADGVGTQQRVARTVQIRRGEWTTLVVRAKFARGGSYELSVNGDPFKGIFGIDTTKSGDRTLPFGGNFGLYGSGTKDVTGKPLGDQVVEHKNIFLKKVM